MFKKLGMSGKQTPSPPPPGKNQGETMVDGSSSLLRPKSKKSGYNDTEDLDRLRRERDQLKLELAQERAAAFDMKTRLDALTMSSGGTLGYQSAVDIRRASNISLNGAAAAMLMEDAEGSDDGDEVMDMSSMLSERPRTPKGRPGLGPRNSNSSQSRRRLDQLQGGVLRRNVNQADETRNTAFIASFLSEHLNKKHETDTTLQGMMKEMPIPAAAVAPAPAQAAAAAKPTAATPSAATPASAAAPSNKDVQTVSSGAAQRRPSSAKPLHNRTPSFLKKLLAHKSSKLSGNAASQNGMFDGMINLPRGGVYVTSSVGPIQFGMPPETVKDSMELGMNVPSIFVVPPERFNLYEGVNVAEIEFPAFFNYFVLRKKMKLITYRETETEIRAIMQEALLGPEKSALFVDDEYSKFVSAEVYAARANLEKELAYFAAPKAPDFFSISIDSLIDFAYFDDEGKVDLGGGVMLTDDIKNNGFIVSDCGEKFQADKAKLSSEESGAEEPPSHYETFISYDLASSCLQVSPSQKTVSDEDSTSFVIPQFGITVLGNSHGFDPEGSTSGFVVWVNGQGAMVDPPPHSTMLLAKAGIQPKAITAIILTHCHADHEVGTIQKLVTEDKVQLLTTKTIWESFLRKYAAVTGLQREFLQQLVMFRPVYLEEPTYWNGASFRFFYSLHSIPCVGFEATFEGKRVVYSADTYYDEAGLRAMHASGVLSEPRLNALLAFPWDADIVLHEMGVPPIHTPLEALEKLPGHLRKNIHLIHIGAKTARDAIKRGFKIATPGVEHTITLVEPTRNDIMLKFLQLVSTMDIFRGFTLAQALELWFMARTQVYREGSNIVEQGAPGDKFLIILKGIASVVFNGSKKLFRPGDFLGEVSVVTGDTRSATVVADSEVVTFEVDRYAFDYLIMHDSKLRVRMNNLIKTRSDGSWAAITSNQLLARFTSSQKTQLQALLTSRVLRKGDTAWVKGEPVTVGVIISKGLFKFQEISDAGSNELSLVPGMLIFDMGGAMNGQPLTTTLVADADVCHLFAFDADSMLNYLDVNPLLLLALLKSIVII